MLTILEGNHFLVANDLANVEGGVDGLYAMDTRFLSRWRLLLDGRVPQLLSGGTRDYASAGVYAQHDTGSASHPSPLSTIRHLFVSSGALQEELTIENHGAEPVEVIVSYEFDADFLDLFEVKSREFGERDLAFAKTVTPLLTSRSYDPSERVYTFSTEGNGFAASCLIWFSRAGIPGDRESAFEVTIEPRGSWKLESRVVTLSGRALRRPTYSTTFFGQERKRVSASQKRWNEDSPTVEGNLERIPHIYRRSLADLSALRMRPDGSALNGAQLPAAGLPWFMTVFGRDTLLTSLQAMPLGDGLARAALRTLGALQAREDDPGRDAEEGKILHEMRFGKVAQLTDQFPYYGSVDSTPLYLVLLSEVWRWSGDDAIVRELEPVARRCLDWIEKRGDLDGDGFLEFHRRSKRGLEVQCWKDSWDSMQFADGRLARSPLAVCEVQGYAYAARIRVAELARRVWRDAALADRLEADAAKLRDRFDEAFWIERDGRGYYALALDADKKPVDALTSNTGHVLWTGIAKSERIAEIARVMLSKELYSGWAVRSMADSMSGYNPIGYHTGTVWPHDSSFICYGLASNGHYEEATRIAVSLAEAAEHFQWRLPEVIAGYPRGGTGFPVEYPTACSPQAWAAGAPILCLRAMLGLEPDVETRSLRVSPHLPLRGRARFRWDAVPAFGRRWRVDVHGENGTVEALD